MDHPPPRRGSQGEGGTGGGGRGGGGRGGGKDGPPPKNLEFALPSVIYNAIILVINIYHILILTRLWRLNKTSHMKILIIMALSDILFSLTMVTVNIEPLEEVLGNNRMIEDIVLTATERFMQYAKFEILVAAAYDRYMAICKPFSYAANFLLRNIVAVLSAAIITTGIIPITVTTLYWSSSPNRQEEDSTHRVGSYVYMDMINNYGVVSAQILVIFVLCGLALKELNQMRNRPLSHEDKMARNGMIYILILMGCFIFTMIPNYIYVILDRNFKRNVNSQTITIMYGFSMFAFYSYGILNVAIYGLLNKTYRKEVKKTLCCKPNAVHGL